MTGHCGGVRESVHRGNPFPRHPSKGRQRLRQREAERGSEVTHGVRGILLPGDGIIPSLALDLVMRVILFRLPLLPPVRGVQGGEERSVAFAEKI